MITLTKKNINQVAHAMISQILYATDSFAFDESDISQEQKDAIQTEIIRVSEKYANEYSNLGGAGVIIQAIQNKKNSKLRK